MAKPVKSSKFPSIVNLNVGGQMYTTSLASLTRFPESRLGIMFSGQVLVSRDTNGNFFIDRDGALFVHVLHYLRSNALRLPEYFDEHMKLKDEADFYQIPGLAEEVLRDKQAKRYTKEEVVIVEYQRRANNKAALVYGTIPTLQAIFLGSAECQITPCVRRKHGPTEAPWPWHCNYLNQLTGDTGCVTLDCSGITSIHNHDVQICNLLGMHGFRLVSSTSIESSINLLFSRRYNP